MMIKNIILGDLIDAQNNVLNYDMSQYICLDDANNNNDNVENDDAAENNVPRESSNRFPVSPIEFDHLTCIVLYWLIS